jgi:23S rRNA (cytidine1920-2'-O)/16S rRNA (cytidine1409-2'-O)-methyltransferase
MTARQRADRLLVERGLFDSRARAQAAIAAGLVTADGVPVRKASDAISTGAAIEAAPEHPYVSRGGVKLAAALDEFALDVTGRVCLDVGASTGGFAELLVARGAGAFTQSMSAIASFILACASEKRSSRWSEPTSARSIRHG